ncbi:hypothetical protein ILP92_07000 [Maribius pontilimi]|uniref:YfdX protein n=1 Tax=Palleronia pontilimi TaxID=1964209 RepID=A0A934I8V2_9RHOB|nr:hypothetical protein [Palleronia pontilimi]MBJ3762488.1 hypothetical protein [Palleronia pontilimi]
MSETPNQRPRLVNARRVSTLTGVAALTAAGVIAATGAYAEGEGESAERETTISAEGEGEGHSVAAETASGEGEGEGGAPADPDVALLTGLAFMEGHVRAGLALYELGDLAAAKTHMGHPIEEKYEAVEEALEQSGHAQLEDQIAALAAATEAEADLSEVRARFGEMRETMQVVRASYPAATQVESLVALTRIAGEEYSAAFGDDQSITDLHEYQDSWGFLRAVEAEAQQMAEGDDAALAKVAQTLLDQVAVTGAVYGDLQGEGSFDADAEVIYGAAARMELAALTLGHAETPAEGEGEGEGE